MSTHRGVWEWAEDPRIPGFCITFTRDRTPEAVLAAYGADVSQASVLIMEDTADAFPLSVGGTLLRAGMLGTWTFCYENLEPEGFKEGVRSRLSAGTETLELFAGGNGLVTFTYLRDQRKIEFFEPGSPHTVRGDGPHRFSHPVQEVLDAATAPVTPAHAALQVIGQYIGAGLDGATLEGPLLTAFLADTDREMLPPTPGHPLPAELRASLGPGLGPLTPSPHPAAEKAEADHVPNVVHVHSSGLP